MVLPAFDNKILINRLNKLADEKRLVFGALCCERLLPNYKAFQLDTGYGNYELLRDALDIMWLHIFDKKMTFDQIKKTISFCESIVPDSENFDSIMTASAQDACFAICSLFDYLLKNDVRNIVQVATFATDSVDLYIQEIENMDSADPELEDKILRHHLMQMELTQQENDLKFLEQASFIDEAILSKLKSSWNNNGKSNLDLP